MHDYGTMNGEQKAILDGFPTLSAEELEEVNNLFTHYVFFESTKGGRKIYTSCCHKKGEIQFLQETMLPEHTEFFYAAHNEIVRCPYCGKEAVLKNVGRCGKMKKLEQYIPVLFLHERDGDIYAQGYWVHKGYSGHWTELTGEPKYKNTDNYHFTPGKATMFYERYACNGKYEWESVVEPKKGSKEKIKEPFMNGSGMYMQYASYKVINLDAIKKSAFRYCQYESWAFKKSTYIENQEHWNLIKYLASACQYPYAIEMLIKSGFNILVDDLIYQGKKNNEVFDWNETDPRRAFGLSGSEYKEFLSLPRVSELRTYTSIGTLKIYKKLKKLGCKCDFKIAAEYQTRFFDKFDAFIRLCRQYKLKPQKAYKYLDKNKANNASTLQIIFTTWSDYITAAAAIGYDLTCETVIMPRNLNEAHDNATAEHNRRLREIRAAQEREREAERRAKDEAYRLQKEAEEKAAAEIVASREKKYSLELEGFILRPARNSYEVITEGNVLSHCVGGYAERHMRGALTICFLRLASEPDIPLITIELNQKGELVQAHGYRNERDPKTGKTIAPDPREEYSYILKPWLEWIAQGSKRNKDGSPKLQKKKEAKIA